jgi:hypothetical protein
MLGMVPRSWAKQNVSVGVYEDIEEFLRSGVYVVAGSAKSPRSICRAQT